MLNNNVKISQCVVKLTSVFAMIVEFSSIISHFNCFRSFSQQEIKSGEIKYQFIISHHHWKT